MGRHVPLEEMPSPCSILSKCGFPLKLFWIGESEESSPMLTSCCKLLNRSVVSRCLPCFFPNRCSVIVRVFLFPRSFSRATACFPRDKSRKARVREIPRLSRRSSIQPRNTPCFAKWYVAKRRSEDQVQDFVKNEVEPQALEHDQTETFNKSLFKCKLARTPNE